MQTEQEALQRILAATQVLPAVKRILSDALDHFSADDCFATIPLPGYDNSSMDGYAVRAADTENSQTSLKITGEQPAGKARGLTLSQGSAIRIFTGAPIPLGADAVIMQEDVILSHDSQQITCKEPVVTGENIRHQGADLCIGQRILSKGDRLTPARLAVLASQGITHVSVINQPSVAVITTGDELVLPGASRALEVGEIYNSNQILLEGLVRNCISIRSQLFHLPDDLAASIELFRKLIQTYDFVIISGGVSVGDHDHVKPALKALGIVPDLWRVKVKPGKPLLFATTPQSSDTSRSCHIFGLPGNPVSSFVTFLLFVRPSLLKASGAQAEDIFLPRQTATIIQTLTNHGDRPHYIRGSLANGVFTPAGLQQSHALYHLSQANVLLRMEADETLEQGQQVQVLLCQS